MTKKILITGGAGFIGSHLVEGYIEAGYDVVVVDKKEKPEYLKNLPITYYQQDIVDTNLETVFEKEKPHIVNHHAALIHVAESLQNPVAYAQTNVLATIKLLELSRKYGVEQFLFASSVAVYGDTKELPIKESSSKTPLSFYGLDKLMAEWYIQLYSQFFTTTIFRYGNVYGSRQTSSAEGGVVAIFCQALSRNLSPKIHGDGTQTRDFIFVKDIANANILATTENVGGILQVSTGKETSVYELYEQILAVSGKNINPEHVAPRAGDIQKSVLDNSLIQQALLWRPAYDLEKGLKETWEYFYNIT